GLVLNRQFVLLAGAVIGNRQRVAVHLLSHFLQRVRTRSGSDGTNHATVNYFFALSLLAHIRSLEASEANEGIFTLVLIRSPALPVLTPLLALISPAPYALQCRRRTDILLAGQR